MNATGKWGVWTADTSQATIFLNSLFFCHHERQGIELDALLPWSHRIFLRNLIITHDLHFGTIQRHSKMCVRKLSTPPNQFWPHKAVTELSLMQQSATTVALNEQDINNLFSYSTVNKLAAWLHKHIMLQGLFDQLCLQAIKRIKLCTDVLETKFKIRCPKKTFT